MCTVYGDMPVLPLPVQRRIVMTRGFFFIFLLLLIAPAVVFGQSGWYSLKCPIDPQDFDVVSDSLIGVLSGSSTAISGDGGATWSVHSSIPDIAKEHYRSIKVRSSSSISLYGWGVDDRLHGLYHDATASSSDTGKTWQVGDGLSHYEGGPKIFERSISDWFIGEWNVFSYDMIGAYSVRNGRNGRGVPVGRYVICADMRDSVEMAITTDYPRHLFATNDSGKSWSQLPYTFISHTQGGSGESPIVHHTLNGIWLMSDDSVLLRSNDDGKTWSSVRTFDSTILDFKLLDSIGYLVVKGKDYVEKSTDGGTTWYAQSCPFGATTIIPSSSHIAFGGFNPAFTFNAILVLIKTSDGGGPPAPVLSMPRIVPFGMIASGQLDSQVVDVSNVGTDSLRVTGFSADLPSVQISPSQFALGHGQHLNLRVYYSTSNALGDNIAVHFNTNGIPAEQLFHVTGRALLPKLSFSANEVDFGEVNLGEVQVRKIGMQNLGTVAASFSKPLVSSPLFSCTVRDSLAPSQSEVIAFRFAPQSTGSFSAIAVIGSNASTGDTIRLKGTGILSTNNTTIEWQRDADSLSSIATNVATENGELMVVGVEHHSDNSVDLFSRGFGGDGALKSDRPIQSNSKVGDLPVAIVGDSHLGYALAFLDAGSLGLTGLNFDGKVKWRDSVASGISAGLPISLSINRKGDVALLTSDMTDVLTTGDLGHILFYSVDSLGRTLFTHSINGTSEYWDIADNRVGYVNGADFGRSVACSDSVFFISIITENGHGNYDGWSVDNSDLHSETWSYHGPEHWDTFQESNRSGGGQLAYNNGILYEAGKSKDTGFYLLELDNSLHILRRGSIDKSDGLDSIYSVTFDSASQSEYVLGTLSTVFAGRNAAIIRMSGSANELWQRSFDGLGSGDDIPVKLIVDHGFAYVLVQSADTNGNDWVLLKYDSTGKQLFRLRYDGAGHGDDVPRDFAIGSVGAIYVVGGSTNAKGVQQFTVVKYVDSVLASIEPSVPIISHTLDARLSSNPWSTTTSLEIAKSPASRVTVRVLDLLGREYLNRTTTANALSLNSSQFPRGFYTIALEDANGSRKLIKFIRE